MKALLKFNIIIILLTCIVLTACNSGGGSNTPTPTPPPTPIPPVTYQETLLYSFESGPADGANPQAGLIQASDGNFYGTTQYGGANNYGTVFKITPKGVKTILYSFESGPADGANPIAGLIQDIYGTLYGTTTAGGGAANSGTVFRITPAGVYKSLYSFAGGKDGADPQAGLIQAKDGNFYGTTQYGGRAKTYGTVFKITPAGVKTTLYRFAGGRKDGAYPRARLIQGSDGNFYGTTVAGGGAANPGTVFKITPEGVYTSLYRFAGGTADGANPQAGLILGSDGNLYGTTQNGGINEYGTVFKITPAGVETILYKFTGGTADGANPQTRLIQAGDGNFYGTTQGGINEYGTVFKITPAGVETIVYKFTGGTDDGAYPNRLIQGSDGNFYGTTQTGGANTYGTIFKISTTPPTPPAPYQETVLYSFTGSPDGANPQAGLIQGSDGNFYGTTQRGGGANNSGTVFSITPAGVKTTLYSFAGGGSDGALPEAGLTQASDGNFYGTTQGGGVDNGGAGTIFKITPPQTPSVTYQETILYNFAQQGVTNDGAYPQAGLILGSDGNFYGVTQAGVGDNNSGTVFSITPAGVKTTLYSFAGSPDGASPQARLIQASDGNFYGTTYAGGSNSRGYGTVFKITPTSTTPVTYQETILYSFAGSPDGANPQAGLIQASDGNFYGTTSSGGFGYGTIFKITPAGVETILYKFTGGYNDGAYPEAGLIQGSDGNFYGTTTGGGVNTYGTVFKITPAGVETILYKFTGSPDGAYPQDGLIQTSDGNFYGTTQNGGVNEYGTVFKIKRD